MMLNNRRDLSIHLFSNDFCNGVFFQVHYFVERFEATNGTEFLK